ncbi:MAG: metallophosphoesterase [Defluviitaleaceae bacterium]|nr:metallophosphoesterase [Defluviitaleaceae bacterium]
MKIIKKTIRYLFILGCIIVVIHIIHALTLDRIIQYKEIEFVSSRWPEELEGYRIAFITDTHMISNRRLERVVEELNARNIDLLLLGGDYMSLGHGIRYREQVAILSGTQTTDGIYGVEGNHDNYIRLFAAMEAYGMTPLFNTGQQIREGFFLAGVKDLWNNRPCIATSIEGAGDDFVLLLSHNPDVAMHQDTTHIDLFLAGHTHGGQITFFGLWAPYLVRGSITSYNQRFRYGWAESRSGTPVYVSRGIGGYVPRVFARPQVIIITMGAK